MNHPPAAVFGSKDAGNAKDHGSVVLASGYLGAKTLDLHDVREIWSDACRQVFEADDLAVSVYAAGHIPDLGDLLPSTSDGAKRITEAYIVAVSEEHLVWLWVSADECGQRSVVSVDRQLKIE